MAQYKDRWEKTNEKQLIIVYMPVSFRDQLELFDTLIKMDNNIDKNDAKLVQCPSRMRSVVIRNLIKIYNIKNRNKIFKEEKQDEGNQIENKEEDISTNQETDNAQQQE